MHFMQINAAALLWLDAAVGKIENTKLLPCIHSTMPFAFQHCFGAFASKVFSGFEGTRKKRKKKLFSYSNQLASPPIRGDYSLYSLHPQPRHPPSFAFCSSSFSFERKADSSRACTLQPAWKMLHQLGCTDRPRDS